MNELALFAGAGGGILGGKLLGWRTVCAVECDVYAASILAARQNEGLLAPFPIWDDVCTFEGKPWRGIVDVVSGGFPCQDISCSGKGAGLAGERSGLWREMARIVGEVRPTFVFIENSDQLSNRGLDRVVQDLAKIGYDSRWTVLSAADVGAPHIRKRMWILAYSDRAYRQRGIHAARAAPKQPQLVAGSDTLADASRLQSGRTEQWPERERVRSCGESSVVSNAIGIGCDEVVEPIQRGTTKKAKLGSPDHRGSARGRRWWFTEPNVGRVAHGVAARVDRLRVIGNGQVPLCAATAFRCLVGDLS